MQRKTNFIKSLLSVFALISIASCSGSNPKYATNTDLQIDKGISSDSHIDQIIDQNTPSDSTIDRDFIPNDTNPPGDIPTIDTIDTSPTHDMTPYDIGNLYTGTFPAIGFGFKKATLNVKGQARDVDLYFAQNTVNNPPLVIACHGTGGTGEDAIWGSAANELADTYGVVVAAPNARTMTKGDWDQHQAGQIFFETYPTIDFDLNNDLQLVAAIIAEAKRAYHIDETRVYIAGYSNGAFFAQFAAMRLADRIAAFATAEGGLVECSNTSSCVFEGSGTSCDVLAKQSGWCSCSGDEKPGPINTVAPKPAAYIYHASDDGVVSPYYDCRLRDRLLSLGYTISFTMVSSGGHVWPDHFLPQAWSFLSKQHL